MPATTARADLRDGLYAYLVALKGANPAMFAGDVHRSRPGSIVAPGGYVGHLDERIDQESQVRKRYFAPEVVLVQRLISPDEALQAMDDMVDVWVDYVTDNPHMAGGIIDLVGVRDIELNLNGTIYSASVVTHRLDVKEGRL